MTTSFDLGYFQGEKARGAVGGSERPQPSNAVNTSASGKYFDCRTKLARILKSVDFIAGSLTTHVQMRCQLFCYPVKSALPPAVECVRFVALGCSCCVMAL